MVSNNLYVDEYKLDFLRKTLSLLIRLQTGRHKDVAHNVVRSEGVKDLQTIIDAYWERNRDKPGYIFYSQSGTLEQKQAIALVMQSFLKWFYGNDRVEERTQVAIGSKPVLSQAGSFA